MKKYFKSLIVIAFVSTLGIIISSCGKDEEPIILKTHVLLFHGNFTQGANKFDFYINGSKVNSAPVSYGETNGKYVELNAGNNRVAITLGIDTVAVGTVNLAAEQYNLLYITGNSASYTIIGNQVSFPEEGSNRVNMQYTNLIPNSSSTQMEIYTTFQPFSGGWHPADSIFASTLFAGAMSNKPAFGQTAFYNILDAKDGSGVSYLSQAFTRINQLPSTILFGGANDFVMRDLKAGKSISYTLLKNTTSSPAYKVVMLDHTLLK